MKIHNGELPKHYRNWMHLYRDLEKENLLNEFEIEIIPNFEDNRTHYTFDILYIKNKCFDEIKDMVNEFSIRELVLFLKLVNKDLIMPDLITKLNSKIDERISLRHKFGFRD